MPDVWFGDNHVGNNQTTQVDEWISVTMPRPDARVAMNGKRPFAVREMHWKCASLQPINQVIYARVSNADGSVGDNSYIGNKISWQKEAKVLYGFNSMNLHFSDDDGAKIRFWLVSTGPFIFSRTTTAAGSIQSPAGNYNGTPVGYYSYSQVALPPKNFKAVRASDDPNRVDLSWTDWNVKEDQDACGDTYSLMGYYVAVAQDAEFTKKVSYRPVSQPKANTLYGMSDSIDWYIKIATRNDLSEHYNLYGGIWGDTIKIAKSNRPDPVADPTAGLPDGGVIGDGPDVDPGSDGGIIVGDNPGSTTGQNPGTGTGGTAPSGSGGTAAQKEIAKVNSRIVEIKSDVAQLQNDLDVALENPSVTAFQNARTTLNALRNDINYCILHSAPGSEWLTKWQAALALYQAAYTALTAAASASNDSLTDAQKYASAIAACTTDLQIAVDATRNAVRTSTKINWTAVADALQDFSTDAAKARTYVPASQTNSLTAWATLVVSLNFARTAARTAASTLKSGDTDAAQDAVGTALEFFRSNVMDSIAEAGPPPAGSFDASVAAVGEIIKAALDAAGGTPPAVNVDGSANTDPVNTGTTIVYTPIPDTSYLRAQRGGMLLSEQTSLKNPQYTVMLNDRGGMSRIGQFVNPTRIRWNRIRDDQSEADLVFSGESITNNKVLLDKLATGRHELCIYRGDERVWEGPVTLATWTRQGVEIQAKDITHYLNRLVMSQGYSNAYPLLDYVVNRIAGIIAAELPRMESQTPPVNILKHIHTYVDDDDAKTTRVTDPATMTVWQHLDDLAAKAGIDYTVIGRALHIWDTSKPALGFTRTVTEQDFVGDTYISAYGMELATMTYVSDGQGRYGKAGHPDPFYGVLELIATAYDEAGNSVADADDEAAAAATVSQEELSSQAARNLNGRNPVPYGLHVPDGSAFRIGTGLGMDVLIPGVYVPVVATLSGRTIQQMLKLKELSVLVEKGNETASITLTPASSTGDTLGDGSDEDA